MKVDILAGVDFILDDEKIDRYFVGTFLIR